MATEKTAAPKTTKPAKTPLTFVERTKKQLNSQVLSGKISVDELSDLQQHITKVSGLLA